MELGQNVRRRQIKEVYWHRKGFRAQHYCGKGLERRWSTTAWTVGLNVEGDLCRSTGGEFFFLAEQEFHGGSRGLLVVVTRGARWSAVVLGYRPDSSLVVSLMTSPGYSH